MLVCELLKNVGWSESGARSVYDLVDSNIERWRSERRLLAVRKLRDDRKSGGEIIAN